MKSGYLLPFKRALKLLLGLLAKDAVGGGGVGAV